MDEAQLEAAERLARQSGYDEKNNNVASVIYDLVAEVRTLRADRAHVGMEIVVPLQQKVEAAEAEVARQKIYVHELADQSLKLQEMFHEAEAQRDAWRQMAEKLYRALRWYSHPKVEAQCLHCDALAEFDRLVAEQEG